MAESKTVAADGGILATIVNRCTEAAIGGEPSWVDDVAIELAEGRISVTDARVVCAELAWRARRAGAPIEIAGSEVARGGDGEGLRDRGLINAYAEGLRLKYDYKFHQLGQRSRRWLAEFPEDAFVEALAAFAALGAQHTDSARLLTRALQAPDRDASCKAVCMDGLWFATHLSDRYERMLELSSELVDELHDPHHIYYRRASALRQTGSYNVALATIDQAIELLPPGHNDWHQDYEAYSRPRSNVS